MKPAGSADRAEPVGLQAARRLHAFLLARCWDGRTLGGPDQGVRWQLRLGRFVSNYVPWLERPERFVFQQGQGYWVWSNWLLFELIGEPRFRDLALVATQATADAQLADGSWTYPLPSRRHLKATVEGNWGALALLIGFERTGNEAWLAGALRWHQFLIHRIGFLPHARGRAINYFDRPRGKVPNNSVSTLWTLGEFHRVTREAGVRQAPEFLGPAPDLLAFLESVQLPSGEFPYELPAETEPRTRIHYLCYQYNAFACMRLIWYGVRLHNARALALARASASFLAGGVRTSGACRADCHRERPEDVYYADALGLALWSADRAGLGEYGALARRCFDWVMAQQRDDGGMIFSRGDYGVLTDSHAYPRHLAMTLYHLLVWARDESGGSAATEGARVGATGSAR